MSATVHHLDEGGHECFTEGGLAARVLDHDGGHLRVLHHVGVGRDAHGTGDRLIGARGQLLEKGVVQLGGRGVHDTGTGRGPLDGFVYAANGVPTTNESNGFTLGQPQSIGEHVDQGTASDGRLR